MKAISNFLAWWETTYKKQTPFGKISFGCLSIIAFCCSCSIPVNLLTPDSAQAIPIRATTATTTQKIVESSLPSLTPTPNNIFTFTPIATQERAFAPVLDCVPSNQEQIGKVVDVVDGDTIKVLLDDKTYTVRYIGIDTPESTTQVEYYGEEASAKNKELVSGKEVVLIKDVSEADRYGRLLRYVFVGDQFINYELVHQGYAMAVTDHPDVSCVNLFKSAQSYARFNHLGLWVATQEVAITQTVESSEYDVEIVAVNKVAEYVDIKNIGSSPVSLNGWRLVSEKGNQSCHLGGVIQPGEILRIWAGNPDQSGYKCGISGTVWNNDESDPAVLYDEYGREVSRY